MFSFHHGKATKAAAPFTRPLPAHPTPLAQALPAASGAGRAVARALVIRRSAQRGCSRSTLKGVDHGCRLPGTSEKCARVGDPPL